MPLAPDFREVFPGLSRWSAYSPVHKVELSAHVVWNGRLWIIFDPIPLVVDALGERSARRTPGAIVLTNENHERDAAAWRERVGALIWAAPDAQLTLANVRRWTPAASPFDGWELIPLPGGAGGETAFHLPAQSLVVFGDAVVNLPGRGLEVLPDKYCRDPVQLRASLRRLPAFNHAVFAHGEPLLGDAAARIAALL